MVKWLKKIINCLFKTKLTTEQFHILREYTEEEIALTAVFLQHTLIGGVLIMVLVQQEARIYQKFVIVHIGNLIRSLLNYTLKINDMTYLLKMTEIVFMKLFVSAIRVCQISNMLNWKTSTNSFAIKLFVKIQRSILILSQVFLGCILFVAI